ncbi:hypothetical protein AAG747_23315 [Rapidithrix thailandica]|uniref:Uncharacterized protein n=1 Tax=Rapidithrix thailandica TaxID=413964 RepID=A0AAW9S6Q3_9BACT
MKKLTLYFFALLFAGFFASCSDDDDDVLPQDKVKITAQGFDAKETITLKEGEVIKREFRIVSEEKLSALLITSNGGVSEDLAKDGDAKGKKDFTFDLAAVGKFASIKEGEYVYTIKATDKDENTQTLTVNVVVSNDPETTLLDAAKAFEFKREGGNDGTGLEEFGLAWTSNTTTHAVIKKGADKFVKFDDAEKWESITTKEALKAAVDAATGITEFKEIKSTENGTYNFVVATQKGDTYYILHITKGEVTSSGAGTTITITGQYKM